MADKPKQPKACSRNNGVKSATAFTSPEARQPVQPAVINRPTDLELQRRIEEAQRLAREKAEKEQGKPAPTNADKVYLDPQVWVVEFERTRKDGRDRIGSVIDRMNRDILAVINAIPPTEDRLRSKMMDEYNNYVQSDYTAIPLYPEFGAAGLKYVKERMQLEREYAAALRRLAAQKMPESGKSGVTRMLEAELARSEIAIQRLELIEPLLVALADKPMQLARQPPQPSTGTSNKPEQPAAPVEERQPPISQTWKVRSDAGPALPTWSGKLAWSELRVTHPTLVFAPPGPSRFLMVGQSQGGAQYGATFDRLLIGDLQTGKLVGLIDIGSTINSRPTQCSWRPALSRDGQRVAYRDTGTIRVMQTRSGKLHLAIPLPDPSEFALYFPRPDRLLALDVAQAKKGMVFDLNDGKTVTSFPVEYDAEDQTGYFAISPGGRFLAMACKKRGALPDLIVIVDLTTGQKAGELYPGDPGDRTEPQVNALAFSPDGQELAAFVGTPDRANLLASAPTLFVWNLDTGQEVTRVVVETGGRGQVTTFISPEPLQWFPDQKAVLIHHQLVINRADGKLLDVVLAEGDVNAHYATKVLDDNRVITVLDQQKLIIKTVKRTATQ
ncbi:MAG: hypothetical protein KatS3mg110_0885 [Pirellulaceae bacterium]|nr:MAG: hypothetical protein KatS3mg110_0885 [Pirellulaceae bacterium]